MFLARTLRARLPVRPFSRRVFSTTSSSRRGKWLTAAFGATAIGAAVAILGSHQVVHTAGETTEEKKSNMLYNRLGSTGLWVSALSFGAWLTFSPQTSEAKAVEIMKTARECGINYFDNAEGYDAGEAEVLMGNAIKKLGWNRNSYVISTKIFFGGPDKGVNDFGLSRKHIIEGLNGSLKRLQLDYVDVVFAHRPDFHTTIEEVVRAMNHVIDKGQAFYWGTSEWSAEDLREAFAVAARLNLIPPSAEQPQYNLLHRQRFEQEYASLFKERKLGSTIWSPLASGVLTGKYNKEIPAGSRLAEEKQAWLKDAFLTGSRHGEWEEIVEKVVQLDKLAARLGATTAQLAIAWTLTNPNVSTVLFGASKTEQIKENVKALDLLPKLTSSVLAEIEAIMKNKPIPPKDFTGRADKVFT